MAEVEAAAAGKGAARGIRRGCRGGDLHRAGAGRCRTQFRGVAARPSRGECAGFVRRLPLEDGVADVPDDALSVAGVDSGGGNGGFGGPALGDHGQRVVDRASRPYLPVGWFWYVATLFPVIGIVQVGTQARADRFMYVPAIGPFVMFTWRSPSSPRPSGGAPFLPARAWSRGRERCPGPPAAGVLAGQCHALDARPRDHAGRQRLRGARVARSDARGEGAPRRSAGAPRGGPRSQAVGD